MIELDEELEAQLYSQIYHSTEAVESEVANLSAREPDPDENMVRRQNRYFQSYHSPKNYFEDRQGALAEPQSDQRSLYEKNYLVPRRRDISINQLVVVNPPPPGNVFYLASEKRKKSKKRRKKNKEQRPEQLEREPQRKERTRLPTRKMPPRSARLQAQEFIHKMQAQSMQNQQSGQPVNRHTRFDNDKGEVIALSETDSDDCVEIRKEIPTYSVESSDDEAAATVKEETVKDSSETMQVHENTDLREPEQVHENNSQDHEDDVIYIQPVIEIINVDEELEVVNPTNTETTSEIVTPVQPQDTYERRDLLNTPDSAASNDFINSGIELSQGSFKFNFSLHGSDFNNGEFLKPANPAENFCESASSSSTTDVNTSPLKAAVFNEIEFPRDDLFSEEGNLESFGNFITPVRKSSGRKSVESSTPKDGEESDYEDSESDFEASAKDMSCNKSHNLPNLSVWHDDVADLTPQKKKKSKKGLNINSKFDFAAQDGEKSKKKKKKSKKRRDLEENDETESSKGEKKKKRKSVDECETPKKKASEELEERDVQDSDKKKKRKSLDECENSIKKKNKTDDDCSEKAASEEAEIPAETQPESAENPEKNVAHVESIPFDDDLVVLDETFDSDKAAEIVLSSDSESNMSDLGKVDADIQLGNLSSDILEIPSTSSDNSKPCNDKLNLSNASVQEMQRAMSDDPNLWKILPADLYQYRTGPKGRRCNRCKEFGHVGIKCTNYVAPKCRLCGESGHFEPRCSNRICHQCGAKSQYSTTYCKLCFKLRDQQCKLCKCPGHTDNTCPDLWRRYHLTTQEGPLVRLEGPSLKPRHQLWCSGCAKSGHLEHNCPQFKSSYPIADPAIKSYDDIYGDHQESRGFRNEANYYGDCLLLPGVSPPPFPHYENIEIPMLHFPDQNSGFAIPPLMSLPLQIPPATQAGPSNYYFQNNLPNYISFEDARVQVFDDQQSRIAPQNVNVQHEPWKKNKEENQIFFSSSARDLQIYINNQVNCLLKMSYNLNNIVKNLKKSFMERNRTKKFYRMLNMVLFGVFHMHDGKSHLDRLKSVRMEHNKLSSFKRRALFRSYNFIFAQSLHRDVDYNKLLKMI